MNTGLLGAKCTILCLYGWSRHLTLKFWILSRTVILSLVKFPRKNAGEPWPIWEISFLIKKKLLLMLKSQNFSAKELSAILSPGWPNFLTHIFGTYPLIFNLKALNDSVVYHHFKLDTLKATVPLITPWCYMTSLDLKDAYYSIPIK